MFLLNVELCLFVLFLLSQNTNAEILKNKTHPNKISKISLIAILTDVHQNLNNNEIKYFQNFTKIHNYSRIDDNLVYWINSGGADLYAINNFTKEKDLNNLINETDGLIIHDYDNYDFEILADKILTIIMKNNHTYFPVLGIGKGANLIQKIIAKQNITRDYHMLSNEMLPVEIIGKPKRIKLISHFDGRDLVNIKSTNIEPFFVHEAVDYLYYDENNNLKKKLKIVGLTSDSQNNKFVSMFEGIELPFYGLVFNPEKVPWERNLLNSFSFNSASVTISQKFLNFFIAETLKHLKHKINSHLIHSNMTINIRKNSEDNTIFHLGNYFYIQNVKNELSNKHTFKPKISSNTTHPVFSNDTMSNITKNLVSKIFTNITHIKPNKNSTLQNHTNHSNHTVIHSHKRYRLR